MAGEALVGQVVGFSQVSETAGFTEAHIRTKHRSVKNRVLAGDMPAQRQNVGNTSRMNQRFDSGTRNRRSSDGIYREKGVFIAAF